MPEAGKCAWVVTAGIIPNQPIERYTRQWSLSSSEWYGENGEPSAQGAALFNAHLVAAQEYARYLMNPGALNWVRVEWVWF